MARLRFFSLFLHGRGAAMRRIAALVGRRLAFIYLARATRRPFVATPSPLNPSKKTAIWVYSTPDGWYERINQELRDDEVSTQVADFVPILDGALTCLFCSPSVVFRGIQMDAPQDLATEYRLGRHVTWDAYSSASTNQDRAFWGNVLFTITSRTGRIVGKLSAVPDEDEVLFERRTRFKVVYAEIDSEFANIELIEV